MTQTIQYRPKGVCSQAMTLTLEDDIITHVDIVGGCVGNLIGISKILVGMHADHVIERFQGIHCGNKPTSCPDQIAQALIQRKE